MSQRDVKIQVSTAEFSRVFFTTSVIPAALKPTPVDVSKKSLKR